MSRSALNDTTAASQSASEWQPRQTGKPPSLQAQEPDRIDRRRHPPTRALIGVTPRGAMQPRADTPDDTARLAGDIANALHLWPMQVDLTSRDGIAQVRQRLERALRGQRRQARSHSWSYDIACHARLLALRRRLAQLPLPSGGTPPLATVRPISRSG